MFIFAHIGIGRKIASPWSRGLPLWPLVLGCLLPDIIDKPLFYGFRFLHWSAGESVITGTRTFGHTAILLILILAVSGILKSKTLSAVSLGMATHLLLDNVGDHLHGVFSAHTLGTSGSLGTFGTPNSASIALLWPLLGVHFASFPFSSLHEHLMHGLQPEILIGEVLGLLFIAWDYWKSENKAELHRVLFSRRYRLLRRHRWGRD
jgi:hypothetical protein